MENKEFDNLWQSAVEKKLFSTDSDREKIRENIQFRLGEELENAELSPNSVDVIFSEYALNFVEDTFKFSKGARKLLKPGGLFVGYIESGNDGVRNIESVEELKIILKRMGFEDNNIVIVDGQGNARRTEYLFFARKSLEESSPEPKELSFVPYEDKPAALDGFFPLGSQTELIRNNISKDWQKKVILSDLSQKVIDLNQKDSQKAKTIINSLYLLIREGEKLRAFQQFVLICASLR